MRNKAEIQKVTMNLLKSNVANVDKEALNTKRNRTQMTDYMIEFYFKHKDKVEY
ncbi:hypothetical protein ACIQFL_09195 [Bacillus toyonensis]|uniref:hypothetical protein n=1 Tax=Bacillus toyonensis TaxID=155322 RepID=UPI003824DEBD